MIAKLPWMLAGALVCLAGCANETPQRFDWLDERDGAQVMLESVRFEPKSMVAPQAHGMHAAIERNAAGRDFRWSRGAGSQFAFELLTLADRRLILDGFPMPHPDGRSQTVEVVLNGQSAARLVFAAAARQTLDLDASLLRLGRNELELSYGHVAVPSEVLSGSDDARRLAMAWYEVAIESAPKLPVTAVQGIEQRAPSVRTRWTALDRGIRWRGRGEALFGEAVVGLWVDPGDGEWRVHRELRASGGATIDFDEELEALPGEVVRLGVAVQQGAVAWESLHTEQPAPRQPLRPIVLITLDTTRRDALGFYAAGARTPTLDRLAQEGIVFEQAYAVAPVTAPTHASLLLSAEPRTHGLLINGRPLPRADGRHLAVQAKAFGYRTAAFVSLGVLADDLGFGQGFDHFDDTFSQGWWRFAAELNARALPWIAEHPNLPGEAPGLLWVHYADPHRPYGRVDEPGQGLRVECNGVMLGSIPSLGLQSKWKIELPAGRSVLRLSAPVDFDDARSHWYVCRDARIAAGDATLRFGTGWTEMRGYQRMREQATFVLDAERAQEIDLWLIMEDLPTEADARRRYADEIEAVDAAIAELVATLRTAGWLEEGLIVIAADHGEDLGEGGHFGHVEHVRPTLMHIPMFLWAHDLAPARLGSPVSQIDLAPTIFAWAQLPAPAAWQGVDARSAPPARILRLESFPPEAQQNWRGIVSAGRFARAIHSNGGLDSLQLGLLDPALSPWTEAEARALLGAWDVVRPAEEPDAAMQERLRALGYIR